VNDVAYEERRPINSLGDVATLLLDSHLHEMIVSSIYWNMKMSLQPIRCIHCNGINIVKFGKPPEGKQRYKCQEDICNGRTFILDYSRERKFT